MLSPSPFYSRTVVTGTACPAVQWGPWYFYMHVIVLFFALLEGAAVPRGVRGLVVVDASEPPALAGVRGRAVPVRRAATGPRKPNFRPRTITRQILSKYV